MPDATGVQEVETPKTQKMYRLFKFTVLDYLSGMPTEAWVELPEITGESTYTYYPTARDVGELHGPGRYMYFATEGYSSVSFLTIVAVTSFEQASEDEEAS